MIQAQDKTSLATTTFTVKVPITITPASWNFLTTDPAKTFTVTGAGTGYTWDIMDSLTAATPVPTPGEYGTWSGTKTTTVATNNFDPSNIITAVKTFFIRVTVTGDADLTAGNGLNMHTVGPFHIIPIASYTVNVKKADGTALSGATVTVHDRGGVTTLLTGSGGAATFSLPSTGGKYLYDVSLTGYVSQSVSSDLAAVNVTLAAQAATISGTVDDSLAAAIEGATVTAYLPADVTTQYKASTNASGFYAIALPAGVATTGWTVVAASTTFTSKKQTGITLAGTPGTATVNFTGANALAAAGAGAPDVDAGGGLNVLTASGQTVDVRVAAGGLAVNGFIIITQAAKASTAVLPGSPAYVYDVKATSNAAGTTPLAAADIKRIIITLPVDLGVVAPGDMEKGSYVIYTAATKALLEAGSGSAVPLANIISVDYIGNGAIGSVTFWVDHLTWFGIGVGSAGGSSGSNSASGCFIATAAYGSYFEKHVQILRNFRDAYLMTNDLGRAFVGFYYRHSPAIADVIARHDSLRAAVRLGLAPVIGVAYVTIHTTPVQKILIMLLMIGILTAGMVMIFRTRRVRRVIG